jgi:hypothetical protein
MASSSISPPLLIQPDARAGAIFGYDWPAIHHPGVPMSGVNPPLSGSVNLPLSGSVSQTFAQTFAPWMNLTVNLGQSTNPEVEKDALCVASYGKQLGRIGDALIVLLRHFEHKEKLDEAEKQAITDLQSMLNEIANVKEKHGVKPTLRPK